MPCWRFQALYKIREPFTISIEKNTCGIARFPCGSTAFLLYYIVFLIVPNFRITECQVLFVQEHKLLASSIMLPHKPKSNNQPLFSNSTKPNCSNAAVTVLSSHKANPTSTQHFLIQFQTCAHFNFQVTAACYCVGHYTEQESCAIAKMTARCALYK